MISVNGTEDKLVALQEATDQLDQAEAALKASREQLAEAIRAAWSGGTSVYEIQKVTGFSRGHVYDLLGPLTRSHSEVRRERRRRVTRKDST